MAKKAIQSTKNYGLFERHDCENRPVSETTHRGLLNSMKAHGFIPEFPIVVTRSKNGKLIVKDGQHRLLFAETLGLPVYWVEASNDFDIAIVNSAAKAWVLKDYAQKHAANGNQNYVDAISFAERYRMPIGTAFGILSGTCSPGNIKNDMVSGSWKIKDRDYAERVAMIYSQTLLLNSELRNARFLEACMYVCRIPDFDDNRYISNARRCREKLIPYSTREAYLDMIEDVYNFHRSKLVGIRAAAITAMRERNAVVVSQKNKQLKSQSASTASCRSALGGSY